VLLFHEMNSSGVENTSVNYEAAPEVVPPILLCWPMTSKTDVGGMAVEVAPSHHIPLRVVAAQQMAVETRSDKMASDTEVCVNQRDATEFPHEEKTTHSLTLAEHLWRPSSEREHSEAAGGQFHQWQ